MLRPNQALAYRNEPACVTKQTPAGRLGTLAGKGKLILE